MAQSSAGIQLAVKVGGTTWTALPGITSIPDLGAEPDSLDTTDLDATEYKTSIPGLMDVGSLAFDANLTSELLAITDGIEGTSLEWAVIFPAPLSKYYTWTGRLAPVAPSGIGVGDVVVATLSVSMETAITPTAGTPII